MSKGYCTECGVRNDAVLMLQELARAYALIRERGALVTEADGFRWVDMTKMPEGFESYYTGLVHADYLRDRH